MKAMGPKGPSIVASKLLYLLTDQWSLYMFLVCMVVQAWWFFLFKNAENVLVLMPPMKQDDSLWSAYDYFFVIFLAILGCKNVAVLLKIIE